MLGFEDTAGGVNNIRVCGAGVTSFLGVLRSRPQRRGGGGGGGLQTCGVDETEVSGSGRQGDPFHIADIAESTSSSEFFFILCYSYCPVVILSVYWHAQLIRRKRMEIALRSTGITPQFMAVSQPVCGRDSLGRLTALPTALQNAETKAANRCTTIGGTHRLPLRGRLSSFCE